MKGLRVFFLALAALTLWGSPASAQKAFAFDFYGDSVSFRYDPPLQTPISPQALGTSVAAFFQDVESSSYAEVARALNAYREAHHPDDWIFYQLVRKTAGTISPKADNYYRYTLFKCFLLGKAGFDVALARSGTRLFFFVRSDDEVYDVPSFSAGGKRYVCLNFHDYGYTLGEELDGLRRIGFDMPGAEASFSYALNSLPRFRTESYHERNLRFDYNGRRYNIAVRLNDEIKQLFVNYPVTDYRMYLNSPLSAETYNSLIPQLRAAVAGKSTRDGIAWLMHFTRNAFPYVTDANHFGREKHLLPEQTLLYESSDCEDRAALFYALVRELYNVPMVILQFPRHVTVAVQLEKPTGRQIRYNGRIYSVCEPTPQDEELGIGELPRAIRNSGYEVAFSYIPSGQ